MNKDNKIVKFVKNWTHTNLIRDLKNKHTGGNRKDRKPLRDIPYKYRPNQLLLMAIDEFSEDLTDNQRQELLTELQAQIKMDPLSTPALNRTDGLRMKFFPYFRRGAPLNNQKDAVVKYFKRPKVPQTLVRNVWRLDLGMANTVENRKALSDIGLEFPASGDSVKTMRIAAFGLCMHSILAVKQFGKRDKDTGNRPVTQVELLAVPNAILDAMVGYTRDDGSRSTANIPESWRRWQSNEVEESLRLGRSAEGRQPTQAKVTRKQVKPKGKKKPIGTRNRGNRSENTNQKKEEDSPSPKVLRDKHGFMTVKELRNLCTENKVLRGGNKDELLARLYDIGVLEL
jgi:hypothetical protein